jgi:Tfp pilus assembly protein PilF
MFNRVPDFLSNQVKRSLDHGDQDEAMEKLKRFLELDRTNKAPRDENDNNVRCFPAMKLI